MLNKTLCLILLCTFLYAIPSSAQIRIKRIFQDQNYNNRTNVVKEIDEDNYRILDEQFGDAKLGEVIRITLEDPPKAPKEKVVKPKPVRSKPVKEVEKLPKVEVEKEVFRAKGVISTTKPTPPPPAPRVKYRSASPSEYAPYKAYHAQLPKIKFWKKKKKRTRKSKSGKSCYHF